MLAGHFLSKLLSTSGFLKIGLLFYMDKFVPACMNVYHECASCLQRSEEGVASSGTRVANSGELPRRCWKQSQAGRVFCKSTTCSSC